MTRTPAALLVCPPAGGAINFARDDALLACARATGREIIRTYSWAQPVVSFGRNERVRGRFSAGRLRASGVDATRRQTGGRALFHHRELTYAIAGPVAAGETLRSAYTRINAMLADALRLFGIDVCIAHAGQRAPSDGAPCFADPSPGELVVGGRKLAASAQWREVGAFLQHGSILIDDDQPLLNSALEDGVELPAFASRPATLRELLGRAPSAAELADAIATAITATTGVAPDRVACARLLPESDVQPRALRYRDAAWTWRR